MRRVDQGLAPIALLALLAPIAAIAAVVGCSSSSSHPALAPACAEDAKCTSPTPIGGGGGGGGDGGTTDASADAGDASVEIAVAGEVRQPQSFPAVVSSAPLATTNVDVTAPRFDGTRTEIVPAGGAFSFPAVARGSDGNWLFVRRTNQMNAIRTLAWIDTSAGALTGQELPLWPDELPQVTATQMGIPGSTTGTATVVVRAVDASGNPLAGVTTTLRNYVDPTLGFFGPYFDNGGDQLTSATSATGTRGTLVYLAVTRSLSLDVPLHFASGDRIVGVELLPDAVSYRVVRAP